MSSIYSSPTTIFTVATATSIAEPTVSVIIEPPAAVFLDSSFESLSIVNIAILLASLVVASILGFNRLVAIPIIASTCGTLCNSMDWYAYASSYPLSSRRVAAVFADICWGGQDASLPLYSFFMLEKLLRGRQRVCFMSCFGLLFATIVSLRLGILVLHDKVMMNETLNPPINQISRAYFLALACIETLSATFLLRVFYAANMRSNFIGSNTGLFMRLAHSSELRVATLAGIGLTRAICFGMDSKVPVGFDNTAYILQNMFPIALLIDLLTAKVTKLQATIASIDGSGHLESGSITAAVSQGTRVSQRGSSLGNPSSKGGCEACGPEPEYQVYAGKGWSGRASVSMGSGIPAVKELPEGNDLGVQVSK